MALEMLNPSPAYAPPTLAAPPTGGYLHIAAAVAPPVGPPFVRRNSSRTALLRRLKQLTGELERLDAVQRVTVYRAVLIPPLGGQTAHPARYDVAVLIETRSPQTLDDVGSAAAYEQLLAAITAAARDVHVMAAGCVRSLGEVEQSRGGLFLFNHFATENPGGITRQAAIELWEHLAGWYVAETGLDNSTLLAPIEVGAEPSDYVLVNHARWDKAPMRLAAEQFGKPSFYSYVRANLAAAGVIAMPVLYRLA